MLGWLINVQLSIPAIVLAICISAVLGNGLVNVVLAISITLESAFRAVRDTRLLPIGGGTSEVMKEIIWKWVQLGG